MPTDPMSPEEMRVRIAEACGFKRESWPGGIFWYNPDHHLCADGEVINDEEDLPDYLNDLNACHEMEKHLVTDEQIESYLENLTSISGGDTPTGTASFVAYFATAAQRAKAFCLTLNLTTPRQ